MYIYCGLLISTIFNLPQLLTRLLFKLDYNRDELALESEILMKSLNAGQGGVSPRTNLGGEFTCDQPDVSSLSC